MTTSDEQQDVTPPAPQAPHLLPPPPAVAARPELRPARPASLIVISILFLIGGVSELLGLAQSTGSKVWDIIGRVDSVLFFIVLTAIGIGLLLLKPWARTAAVYAIVMRFVTTLVFLVPNVPLITQGEVIPEALLIGILIGVMVMMGAYYGVLIYFLTRPYMKAAFAREGEP